jgi:hypothetical protein
MNSTWQDGQVNKTLKDQIAQMHAFSQVIYISNTVYFPPDDWQKTYTPNQWKELTNSASGSQPIIKNPIEPKTVFKPPYLPWDPTDTKS